MKNLTILFFFLAYVFGFSQQDSLAIEELTEADILMLTDSINNSYQFEHGTIVIADGLATINVPKGFKYLDQEQSKEVLTDLWGNPPAETLGMLFPADSPVIGKEFTYAIEITYSEEGYVDDEDAKDIDYDDLLDEMKSDMVEANKTRTAMGYETVEMVGWASEPFYDETTKKLHWAKELRFEGEDENTLNYDIRILGRKGYLSMNAISEMNQLPLVKENIGYVLNSVEFNPGSRYTDFNPDFDEVAAYGVGGLVAGKVLAKTGFFAIILKFWKFIALGAVGFFGAFKKRLFGSKES